MSYRYMEERRKAKERGKKTAEKLIPINCSFCNEKIRYEQVICPFCSNDLEDQYLEVLQNKCEEMSKINPLPFNEWMSILDIKQELYNHIQWRKNYEQ